MGYTAGTDLNTLLTNNFIHTNVSGLSADPSFILREDYSISSFPSDGLMIISDEQLVRIEEGGNYRQEIYVIKLQIVYNGTTTTPIKEMITELDRIFNANNASLSRAYYIKLLYGWDVKSTYGVVDLQIQMEKEWTVKV